MEKSGTRCKKCGTLVTHGCIYCDTPVSEDNKEVILDLEVEENQ